MFMAESNVGHKRCREKDLVINTMWAWMGALGVSRFSGLVSPSYGVYRPLDDKTEPSYLDSLLRTSGYVGEYTTRSTGINSSRLRLYPERFLSLPILLPPTDEQIHISSFIRRFSSQIQKLIRAKRRVIELLNEQKQAIIHRAVTRGLDAAIAFRPTGWEWVGSVPHHWNAPIKLKYISSLKGRLGWQGLKASEYTDSGPYVLSSAHFRNQRIDWKICPHVTKERYDVDENIQLREKDILLMKDGAAMGKLAFVDHLPDYACLNSHLLLFRPVIDNGVNTYDPKFLFYFMLTRSFQDFIQVNGTGTTFLGVSQVSLGNYKVCLPPIQEQRQIAMFMDLKTSQYDNAIASVETQIQLLRDYRTRLTADVVTGKLDVRAVELPELSDVEEVRDVEDEEPEDSEELEAVEENVDAD
jgi:type I restriction enzyme S subunit